LLIDVRQNNPSSIEGGVLQYSNSPALSGLDVHPAQERFYLLNVASWRQPRMQANDMLVLNLGDSPRLTPLALAPAPLWGAIVDGALYTYHNPMWNQLNADPQRSLSRLDLHSGQVQTWRLPANWEAGDLTMLNGQITLIHQDDQQHVCRRVRARNSRGVSQGAPVGAVHRLLR
jgi:hypothetical protein